VSDAQPRWSMRRRIGGLIALLSVAPVLLSALIGVFYLEQSVQRELRALVREEIEEARGFLLTANDPLADFDQVVRELARHHPDVDMAWRLRQRGHTRDFGRADLQEQLADAEDGDGAHEVRRLSSERLATSASFEDFELTLLLDGSRWLHHTRDYWLVAGATIALSLLLSLLAAHYVSRRFGSLLDSVASRLARQQHGDDGDLPAELLPIVQQLEQMLHDVRRRADEAKVFTTGLAHELRSPIQNLIGEAEVARMRPRSEDEYRALLGRQIDELGEFARAVDNLLYLCSVAEPARARGREPFDLAHELEVRLDGEHTYAGRRGTTIQMQLTGDCRMRGDREAVLRAVRNITHNAIKWTPRGGEVRLVVDGTGDDVVVEVHDGGPGIPPEDRARMFTPFVQGRSPDGERTGFGLGLAITRAVAEQHDGAAAIDDSPAGGALLRLVLGRGGVPKAETATANA